MVNEIYTVIVLSALNNNKWLTPALKINTDPNIWYSVETAFDFEGKLLFYSDWSLDVGGGWILKV